MTAQDSVIHVAFVCDERYAMPLAVALASVQSCLSAHQRLIAHVLESGFTASLRERVAASLLRDRAQVHWHQVEVARFASLRATVRSFDQISLASYFRLLIAYYLPRDLTRVIYLDCDLVVETDLARLWDQELNGHLLAAVPESGLDAQCAGSPAGIPLYRELGLCPDLGLFNAGVMVLNLTRWRNEHVAERCLSYLNAAGDAVLWHDQEALNVIAGGDWKALDARWNVMMHAFRGNDAETVNASLRRDPWILHFNSACKPWHPEFSLGGAERFFQHLDRTAWTGWRPTRSGALGKAKAALTRAILKRVDRAGRVARGAARALSASMTARRVLRQQMRLFSEHEVPSGSRGEIRALLVLDDASHCCTVADELLARGAQRVIIAAPGPLPNCDGRPVHLYRWDPGRHSTQEMLARLLFEHGDGHWCVLYRGPLGCDMLLGSFGLPGTCDLEKEVARLEAEGAEALFCLPRTGDDFFVYIDGFARNLLAGCVVRGGMLVEPLSGRPIGRLALVKGHAQLQVAVDFSTASGIRASSQTVPFVRRPVPL